MRSMPSAMPHSVAPTMIDCATRCSVSMLEPHWRFVSNVQTSGGQAGEARDVVRADQDQLARAHDVAEADVLDHPRADLRVALHQRAHDLAAGFVEPRRDELAAAAAPERRAHAIDQHYILQLCHLYLRTYVTQAPGLLTRIKDRCAQLLEASGAGWNRDFTDWG